MTDFEQQPARVFEETIQGRPLFQLRGCGKDGKTMEAREHLEAQIELRRAQEIFHGGETTVPKRMFANRVGQLGHESRPLNRLCAVREEPPPAVGANPPGRQTGRIQIPVSAAVGPPNVCDQNDRKPEIAVRIGPSLNPLQALGCEGPIRLWFDQHQVEAIDPFQITGMYPSEQLGTELVATPLVKVLIQMMTFNV